jgi:uncharacterized protein with beta-barrel porin domain
MQKFFLVSILLRAAIFADTTLTVSNSNPSGAGSLAQAISDVNAGGDTVFNVAFTTNPITLTGPLPLLNLSGATPLTATVNFNPAGGAHIGGLTIDGSGTQSLFFIAGGTVTMDDMIVTGGLAQGGFGQASGGGALGAGGAVFVATGATFEGVNMQFTGNQATGGAGGAGNIVGGFRSSGGGGGMLQGNGGAPLNTTSGAGGAGIMANGQDSPFASGGAGGGPAGGAGGNPSPPGPGGNGGYASGGGGAGSFVITLPGDNGANGGDGGYGGGGGASSIGQVAGDGGAGGLGGGGGGGCGGGGAFAGVPANSGGNGGLGGFGAGGGGGGAGFGGGQGLGGAGGDTIYGGGTGGHGSTAPTTSDGGGGGGSALGGAIFVDTGANFAITNSAAFSGNALQFGLGGAPAGDDATAGGNGAQAGSDIFLNSGTTANFAISSSATLTGSIAGFGTILKSGNGPLNVGDISDSNIFEIDVRGGTLTATSDVNTARMSFELTPDPAIFGRLVVTGAANIGATTLSLTFDPGNYRPGSEYEILSSGMRNGMFSSVSSMPAGLAFTLEYRGNNVFVVFGGSAGVNPDGLTGNALAIANCLNTLNPIQYATIFDALNALSFNERKSALDAISPSRNAFGPFMAQNMLFLYQENINLRQGNQRMVNHLGKGAKGDDQIANNEEISVQSEFVAVEESSFAPVGKLRGEAKYSLWLSGLGQFAEQDALNQNPNFHASSGGLLVGFDYGHPDSGLVGCAAGYAHSTIREGENLGRISVDQYLTVLYGDIYWDPFYLELGVWNSIDTFKNRRDIDFGSIHETAISTHLDYQISPHVGLGADWFIGPVGFEPFCNIDWPVNFEGEFHEQGASLLNMEQESQITSLLRIEPGLRLYERVRTVNWLFLFREKLSYVYKQVMGGGHMTVNIIGGECFSDVVWMTSAQHLFSPSLELFGKSINNTFFSLIYDGEFGRGYSANQVMVRVGKYF